MKLVDMHAFLDRLEEFIARIGPQKVYESIFSPEHPTDHTYNESTEFPGICHDCCWIEEEAACSHCGVSARAHFSKGVPIVITFLPGSGLGGNGDSIFSGN